MRFSAHTGEQFDEFSNRARGMPNGEERVSHAFNCAFGSQPAVSRGVSRSALKLFCGMTQVSFQAHSLTTLGSKKPGQVKRIRPIVRAREAKAPFVFRGKRCRQRDAVKFSYPQPRRSKALAQYGPRRARHWSYQLRADGVGLTNSSPIFRQRPKALRSEKDAAPGRST